jgi:hypothetical protein
MVTVTVGAILTGDGIILTMAAGDGIQAGTAVGTVHGIVHGAGVIPITTTVGITAAITVVAGITTIGIMIITIIHMPQAEV